MTQEPAAIIYVIILRAERAKSMDDDLDFMKFFTVFIRYDVPNL